MMLPKVYRLYFVDAYVVKRFKQYFRKLLCIFPCLPSVCSQGFAPARVTVNKWKETNQQTVTHKGGKKIRHVSNLSKKRT